MIDHVALLVRSVDRAAEALRKRGVEAVGVKDEFPRAGTAEVYVGDPDRGARLLLMEAIGPGPYRRALEKRGPGLHHLALEVGDVPAAVARWTAEGWTLRKSGATSWLGRSGAPLLELMESGTTASPLVAELVLAPALIVHLAALDPGIELREAAPQEAGLVLDGRCVAFEDLL